MHCHEVGTTEASSRQNAFVRTDGELVAGEADGGQFVPDQVQVPQIHVLIGTHVGEPLPRSIEAEILDLPGPCREVE